MEVIIEPFDPSRHDADVVANLIFEADPELTSLIMGQQKQAVERFKALMGIDSSPWAARRITVATADDEVVGVIVGCYGDEKREADMKAIEWGRPLGLRWLLGSIRMGMKMVKAVTPDVADDEFYPVALTVKEGWRGKGVGSHMMRWMLETHPKVVIDVNITKDDAIRFYERHGFMAVGENTIIHKGRRIGNLSMRNMQSTAV